MGSISVPLIYIIFYVMSIFLPAETKSFTIASGTPVTITWTRQADGTWAAVDEKGADFGTWSVKDTSVVVVRNGQTETKDVSSAVNVSTGEDSKKQFTVNGKALTIGSWHEGKILLSQDAGPFEKPVVIKSDK